MSNYPWQVRYIHWWQRPVPLLQMNDKKEFVRVGWVWRQRAYLVKRIGEGWVAFVEDQVPDKLDTWFCPHCNAAFWGSTRNKITEAVLAEQLKKDLK